MLCIPLLGGSAASRVMKGRPRRRAFKCYVFNSWWLGGSLVLLEAGVMSPCRRHCPGCDVRAWRASGWGTCRMPKGKLRGVGVLDLMVGVGFFGFGKTRLYAMQMFFGGKRISECRRGVPACSGRALRIWTAAWVPLSPVAPCRVHARR